MFLFSLGNWFSYTFGENSLGVAQSVGDNNANTPGPWNREQYVLYLYCCVNPGHAEPGYALLLQAM